MNLGTLERLPTWSKGPGIEFDERVEALRSVGVEGVQAADPSAYIRVGFSGTGMARATRPTEIDEAVARSIDLGSEATVLHVGTGLESEYEAAVLAAAVVDTALRRRHQVLVETHRATITQDMRRTIDLIDQFPDLRFNADLSHWYTGQEMPYGEFGAKVDFLRPVFRRTRYLHLRLSTSGAIQVPVNTKRYPEAAAHWRELHAVCLDEALGSAGEEGCLPVAPELLPCVLNDDQGRLRIDYAFDSYVGPIPESEQSDRWIDAQVLFALIEELAP